MNRRSNFGKFILLWAGELISSIGGGLTSFGLGVYIFNQTQSATGMALVTLLGFLSRIGYVIAYAISGIAADKLGKFTGLGVGRGAAAGVRIAGICMVLVAVMCSLSASLRRLERAEGEC